MTTDTDTDMQTLIIDIISENKFDSNDTTKLNYIDSETSDSLNEILWYHRTETSITATLPKLIIEVKNEATTSESPQEISSTIPPQISQDVTKFLSQIATTPPNL